MRREIGIILVIAMFVIAPMVVDAKIYNIKGEDLTRDEITERELEGWEIVDLRVSQMWGGWHIPDVSPTVAEPSTFSVSVVYIIIKDQEGDTLSISGGCIGEPVYLDIYKDNVQVEGYTTWTDSECNATFTVTFSEPGQYTYAVYTEWGKLNGRSGYSDVFYVKPPPTPENESVPGFEVIFTIAGLLAVAYLLRRKK